MLPYDLARGAQVYARALCDALDSESVRHQVLTLFRPEATVLCPEHTLGVPKRPFRSLGIDPRVYWRLSQALTRLEPDLLVTHGGEPLKYVEPVRGDIPLLHLRVGISAAPRGARAFLARALMQRADVVAGVSVECLEEAISHYGVDPSRTVLLANGRDPDIYRPGKPKTPPQLVFLGHFAPTKRPGLFLDIVERLRERGIDFSARMIGSGSLLDEAFQTRAAHLGVEIMGRRPDVPALLPDASVLLFTSVPRGEGMPGVIIEAGLCGVPTVATRVPGADTIIQHGSTGLVHAHDDVDALSDSCARLLSDRDLRTRMGSAARAHCVQHFSEDSGFARWRAIMDRAIRSRT